MEVLARSTNTMYYFKAFATLLLISIVFDGSHGKQAGNTGPGAKPGGKTPAAPGTGGNKPPSTPTAGGGQNKPPGGGGGNLPPSGIKDDYPYGSAPPGLVELSACLPFNSSLVKAAIGRYWLSNYDYRCDTNNCAVGCCRYSPVQLKCDYDNLYMQQPVRDEWCFFLPLQLL